VESAAVRRPASLPALVQGGLVALLVLLAAGAWLLTDDRMAGMDAGPGTDLGGLGWFIGVWVVMMAAMMFPSIAPMVVMFARMQTGRREREAEAPAGLTALFVSGYLVSWAAAGLAGYLVFSIGDALFGDAFSWDEAGPYLAGGLIVAAGVYQLTPLKDVCLRYCRSPLMFLLTHSHPGRTGALAMGIEHGGFCVGCCWMLMVALFALGVMSIGWMAFIAALIAVEKLLPWKAVANRGIAVLLVVLGLGVAFAPEDVPGLVVPDSTEANQAMEGMGMAPDEGAGTSGGAGSGMSDEGMGGGGSGAGMNDGP
jgi:predicted metal-binding membrane protein